MWEELLSPPNLITLARITLIPLFVALLMVESRRNSFWAAVIFGAASATDFLDGYVARRTGRITTLGKFLDPLADKLITMSAYVVLVYLTRLPPWVVIVILGREFIISGLRTIAMSEGIVIAASQGGKWKTALQLPGIAALIVHYRYPVDFLVWETVLDFQAIGLWLTYLSLIPSIASAIDYFRGFAVGVAETRTRPAPPPENTPPKEGPMALEEVAGEIAPSS